MGLDAVSVYSTVLFPGFIWGKGDDLDADSRLDKNELRRIKSDADIRKATSRWNEIDTDGDGISVDEVRGYLQLTTRVEVDPEEAVEALRTRGIYRVPGHKVVFTTTGRVQAESEFSQTVEEKLFSSDHPADATQFEGQFKLDGGFIDERALRVQDRGSKIYVKDRALTATAEQDPTMSPMAVILHETVHVNQYFQGTTLKLRALIDRIQAFGRISRMTVRRLAKHFCEIEAYAVDVRQALEEGKRELALDSIRSVNIFIASFNLALHKLQTDPKNNNRQIKAVIDTLRQMLEEALPDQEVQAINDQAERFLQACEPMFYIDKSITADRYRDIYER